MKYQLYSCDGLIGPNHNYCGLAFGNVASAANKNSVSSPKQAALQGLYKMKRVMDLGGKQIVLPPHYRPAFSVLRQLGFAGSDEQVLKAVADQDMQLLANVSSASAMWSANSATVCPSCDSEDGKVHFTTANLNDKFHRSLEATQTYDILRATFYHSDYFVHHQPLPQVALFGDEGAANHHRFCSEHGDKALQLFVYGKDGFNADGPAPKKYPARQTLQATQALARTHQVSSDLVMHLQQNPALIDQGVFHNDVIAMGERNVYIFHQDAYLNTDRMYQRLVQYFGKRSFYCIEVPREAISIDDAIACYFFNSQIIDISDTAMAIIAPIECSNNQKIVDYLQRLIAMDNPIKEVIYTDLTQSMRNGGGPACLRLRVVLNELEAQGINQGSILTPKLYERLRQWINQHYPDQLLPQDLAKLGFVQQVNEALSQLQDILQLDCN